MNTSIKKSAIAAAMAAGVILTVIGSAAPAIASDAWTTNVSCGVGYKCSISSNTSTGVTYFLDHVTKATFATSGSHSWVGSVSAGSHPVTEITMGSGIFYSHSANCYCPPGVTCGA